MWTLKKFRTAPFLNWPLKFFSCVPDPHWGASVAMFSVTSGIRILIKGMRIRNTNTGLSRFLHSISA